MIFGNCWQMESFKNRRRALWSKRNQLVVKHTEQFKIGTQEARRILIFYLIIISNGEVAKRSARGVLNESAISCSYFPILT